MMPADDERDRAIVMITDGEDHESMPVEAARQAAEKGIKIFTVGLGNATEGSRIPIRDEKGNLRYMQYAGKEIWSKVDEATLKKLAPRKRAGRIFRPGPRLMTWDRFTKTIWLT